jgi:hypothetical protein
MGRKPPVPLGVPFLLLRKHQEVLPTTAIMKRQIVVKGVYTWQELPIRCEKKEPAERTDKVHD